MKGKPKALKSSSRARGLAVRGDRDPRPYDGIRTSSGRISGNGEEPSGGTDEALPVASTTYAGDAAEIVDACGKVTLRNFSRKDHTARPGGGHAEAHHHAFADLEVGDEILAWSYGLWPVMRARTLSAVSASLACPPLARIPTAIVTAVTVGIAIGFSIARDLARPDSLER